MLLEIENITSFESEHREGENERDGDGRRTNMLDYLTSICISRPLTSVFIGLGLDDEFL